MEISALVAAELLNRILDDVVAQSRFRRYFKACNSDASLDDLLESARKHFPSFACESLKRKYSVPSSVLKQTKNDLVKEKGFLHSGKKLGFSEFKNEEIERIKKEYKNSSKRL